MEANETLFTKFKEDMVFFRSDLFSRLEKNREDLQEQIDANEQFLNSTNTDLNQQISEVKVLATDNVRQ